MIALYTRSYKYFSIFWHTGSFSRGLAQASAVATRPAAWGPTHAGQGAHGQALRPLPDRAASPALGLRVVRSSLASRWWRTAWDVRFYGSLILSYSFLLLRTSRLPHFEYSVSAQLAPHSSFIGIFCSNVAMFSLFRKSWKLEFASDGEVLEKHGRGDKRFGSRWSRTNRTTWERPLTPYRNKTNSDEAFLSVYSHIFNLKI